jgi:uncharacterized membrane protein YhaH (DUF805 family)
MKAIFDLWFSARGRIGRGQWWALHFGQLVALYVGLAIFVSIMMINGWVGGLFLVTLLVALAVSFVVTDIKRLHDRNKSGHWFLLHFIPFLGSVLTIVELGILPGDPKANHYGPALNTKPIIKPTIAVQPNPAIALQNMRYPQETVRKPSGWFS